MEGIKDVSFEELLHESDFISLNTPLTSETEGRFGTKEFAQMKPTSFLINTSRGGLIRHDELATALTSGQLAGAALDVQVPEPPDLSHPPYCLPNDIVTPHAAFVSEESLADLRQRSAQQVANRLSGHTPDNVVNNVPC